MKNKMKKFLMNLDTVEQITKWNNIKENLKIKRISHRRETRIENRNNHSQSIISDYYITLFFILYCIFYFIFILYCIFIQYFFIFYKYIEKNTSDMKP